MYKKEYETTCPVCGIHMSDKEMKNVRWCAERRCEVTVQRQPDLRQRIQFGMIEEKQS
jgi:hypothetical protein